MISKKNSVLGIIPARGGSKGLSGKNIRDLGGMPLIAHTLRAVLKSQRLTDHVISTDSQEIAQVARAYGGNVPFMRSAALAGDGANVVDVVREVLEHDGVGYEYVALLQPTCPLRVAEDIDSCIERIIETRAASVCSFTKVESAHPHYMYVLKDDKLVSVLPTEPGQPRQQFDDVYLRNGAVYVVRVKDFLKQGTFVTEDCVPHIMPASRAINIDSIEDLQLAEYHLRYASAHN